MVTGFPSRIVRFFVFIGFLLACFVFDTFFSFRILATDGWYNHNWGYRKEITIDHTKVSNTDQSDFPVLINLTDSDLMVHARSDGYDILFTDSTGITKIYYEREDYNASTGTLVAWVKVANLSHLTDTIIYLYYGNSEADDQQDSTGGTWDNNFKGVWHLNDPTNPTDSTSNGNSGIDNGVTVTTGQVGGAGSFNGIDNYIGIVPLGTLSGSFTISSWAKVSDGDGNHVVIGTRNDGDYTFDFKFDTGGDGNNIHGDIGDGSDWITTGADVDPSVFSYSTNTWYQITYVVIPTGYTIYINGNNVASENCGGSCDNNPLFFDSTHNIFIGQVGYDEEWFNGAIDEVRVSNNARSADWIQTEYNNQNNPSAFYSLEDETIIDEVPPTTLGNPQVTIGTSLTLQDWSWTASTDFGSGLSHYHWQVDGGPSGTTVTPNVTTNLPEGNWKFHVKAEDKVGNQSTEQSALLSILSSSISQVTIDNSVPVAWIITPDGVSDPNLDLSQITVLNGDLFEANINTELHLKTLLSSATVTVDVPMGAIVKGSADLWTKTIVPPVASTVTISAPSGFSSQVALAILVGHDLTRLNITKGARIFLEGQAGKKVGYSSQNIFTEITNICSNDSQTAGDNLAEGSNCKIESESDLIIWTKHFSKFVTYDLIASAANVSSSNANNLSSAPGCSDSVTNGKPDLFEIRTNDKTATLYFSPPSAPYNSFYIAYSRSPDSWEYGTEFSQQYSDGVLKQTINLLQPNTKYYFKIRAGNGCATGSWGNTMIAQTTSSVGQKKTFYKNIFTAVVRKIKSKFLPDKEEITIPSVSPKIKPTMTISTVETKKQENTSVKHKFCILWWCF